MNVGHCQFTNETKEWYAARTAASLGLKSRTSNKTSLLLSLRQEHHAPVGACALGVAELRCDS
jgi:hypothetical protein